MHCTHRVCVSLNNFALIIIKVLLWDEEKYRFGNDANVKHQIQHIYDSLQNLNEKRRKIMNENWMDEVVSPLRENLHSDEWIKC